jgi:ribosomal protein RSM22 (predicted rRNA methylase)
VQLPVTVRRQIEEQADALGFAALRRAAASSVRRLPRRPRYSRLADPERTAAYLVTRMPATYAAACAVLREVCAREWALSAASSTPARARARHRWRRAPTFPDAHCHAGGARCRIRRRRPPVACRTPIVIAADIARMGVLPPHDLVIAAYSLGEFGAPLAAPLWEAARVALVLIEPGTPRGFALIRKVRGELLAGGARMIAPCPAETACPLADPDWCHFAARVERSSLHRRVKGGELGYEDEKFSYVALARQPVELPAARIVRRPQHRPGLVEIATCTAAGLGSERIAKHDRDRFRAARKAAWGDAGIS